MKKLIAFFLLIALCVTAQLWSPGSGGGGGSGGSASVTNAVDQISTNGVLAATGITTINYSNATVYKVGSTGFVDIASSGGGTPAGGNGQIQFNDGGAFGGSTNMIFSDSLNRLSLNGASLLFSNSVFSPSLQAYAPGGLVVSAGDGSTSLRLTAGDCPLPALPRRWVPPWSFRTFTVAAFLLMEKPQTAQLTSMPPKRLSAQQAASREPSSCAGTACWPLLQEVVVEGLAPWHST